MQTGIYVRVSTEEQAQEGFSVRAQVQKLQDYASVKDWAVFKLYADEGISGKNIAQRPAMQALIADIRDGHVQNVLVFKIDRLTRSTADLLFLLELFNKHDCAFNSLMESIDTQTASGRMFLKIIGIFAEFERENIVERVKLGNERKVREGYSLASWRICYGYDRPKGQEIQTINAAEAAVVKEIYNMFLWQGMTVNAIAKTLNLRAVPTKEHCSWANHQVKGILTNPTYIGKVRYQVKDKKNTVVCDGLHEPIVSAELFEQVQTLLANNKRAAPTKQPKDDAYFTGVLRCAGCRSKMYPHISRGKRRYICAGKGFGACEASSVGHEQLEQAFAGYLAGFAPICDAVGLSDPESAMRLLAEKQRQLECQAKENKQLYMRDEIEFDCYKAVNKQIAHNMKTLRRDLAELGQTGHCKQEEADLKQNWKALTDAEKRQFLLRFVKRIDAVNEVPAGKRQGIVRVVGVEFN